MKKTLISLGLVAVSGLAMADDALVVDMAPKFESQIRYETVPQTYVPVSYTHLTLPTKRIV